MTHRSARALALLATTTLACLLRAQAPCGAPHLVATPQPANNTGTRLYDVHAFAGNDLWAVGSRWREVQGQTNSFTWILHWDGSRFHEVPSPSPSTPNLRTWCELHAVGGVAGNDVWAAGLYERPFPNNGHIGPQILLLHWDGSAWTQVPEPLPQFTYMASASGTRIDEIVAKASNDVWFFGWWPGDQFSAPGPLTAHWDGSSVTVENVAPLPNSNSQWRWLDVDALPGNEYWGVASTNGGNYGTYVGRRTGGNWAIQPIPTLPITYYQLFGVHAIAGNDVWVAGSEQVLNPSTPIAPYTIHWNGSSWSRFPTTGYVREFVSFASNDVWAFGTTIEHWDGAAWSVVTTWANTLASAQGWAATAVGPCELWTVGTQWSSGNGPPVVALAARLGPANGGAATLRTPCHTPVRPQSLLPLLPPRVGATMRVVVDDPFALAGVSGPAATAWLWAFGPGALGPCGVLVPGLGTAGSALEILVDGSATVVTTAVWAGPGQGVEHAVSVPAQPALVGLALASQAVFLGAAGFAATSALDLVIGQ